MYGLGIYALIYIVSIYTGIDLDMDQAPDAYCTFMRHDYEQAVASNMSNDTLATYNTSLSACTNRSSELLETILPQPS